MDQVMYSHADVWLLIESLQTMDLTRKLQHEWWQKFVRAVCNETANAYSDEWDTASTITKMADDLGSYKLLLNIWLQIEEDLNDTSNLIDK